MPWFRVDDKLHDHRKARRAGKAAMGVWVLAGSWSMDNLTDGFVPESVLVRWGNARDAKALVDASLWYVDTQHGEQGWQFHDWHQHQPTKTQIEADRKAARERLKKWRDNKRGNADGNAVTNAEDTDSPYPSRPDPSLLTSVGLEGGGSVTRDIPQTPFCPLHPQGHDGPCGPCADARRLYEATERERSLAAATEKKARLAALQNCVDCHGTGLLEDAEGNVVGKCRSHLQAVAS